MAEQVMQSQAEADEEDQAPDDQAPTLVLGAVSRHSQMLAERCSLVLAPDSCYTRLGPIGDFVRHGACRRPQLRGLPARRRCARSTDIPSQSSMVSRPDRGSRDVVPRLASM